MKPFFSVIVPVYNVEAYLERCIQSVLEQEFSDYELILVDDGSTDSSPAICDDYLSRYDFIRVIHKPNGGLASARNAGFEIAQGEYIWWVDSDDWIKKGALSALHQAACQDAPDIVKFNYIRVAGEENEILCNAAPGFYRGREQMEPLMEKALLSTSKYCLSAWSHIYKRQFLRDNNLWFVSERQVGSEDYLFNLQALLLAESVCVLKQSFYYYEQRMGSLSQCYKVDSPKKYTELYTQLRAFYQEKNALERYERLICTFYVWHLLHGICISNEYYISGAHTLAEGRKNIVAFLQTPQFRQAIRRVQTGAFSRKQKLQLLAMRWHFEPLFYWLYVVKPKRTKG